MKKSDLDSRKRNNEKVYKNKTKQNKNKQK